jgi:hypothetical protein
LIGLLAILTLSTVLLAVFPADIRYGAITTIGQVHQQLAVITFSSALVMNITGLIFDFKQRKEIHFLISVLITLIVISGMILMSTKNLCYQGFHQRLVVYPELAWFIVQSINKIH